MDIGSFTLYTLGVLYSHTFRLKTLLLLYLRCCDSYCYPVISVSQVMNGLCGVWSWLKHSYVVGPTAVLFTFSTLLLWHASASSAVGAGSGRSGEKQQRR